MDTNEKVGRFIAKDKPKTEVEITSDVEELIKALSLMTPFEAIAFKMMQSSFSLYEASENPSKEVMQLQYQIIALITDEASKRSSSTSG